MNPVVNHSLKAHAKNCFPKFAFISFNVCRYAEEVLEALEKKLKADDVDDPAAPGEGGRGCGP